MKFTLTKINMLTWNFNGYASIAGKSLLFSLFEIICDYHKILSGKLIRKKNNIHTRCHRKKWRKTEINTLETTWGCHLCLEWHTGLTTFVQKTGRNGERKTNVWSSFHVNASCDKILKPGPVSRTHITIREANKLEMPIRIFDVYKSTHFYCNLR